MRIKKLDEVLQIVYGEVYAPGVPDSQGDFMSTETIRKMAHNFLAQHRVAKIDTNHNHEVIDATIVESFIAREDDAIFIPGSWVAGVHIRDPKTWEGVVKGDFNGFSVDGSAMSQAREIEIEIPEYVTGKTDVVKSHVHGFKVFFDEEGNFLGGETTEVEGHKHEILKGTVTEEVDGHTHRFSFVEVLANGKA